MIGIALFVGLISGSYPAFFLSAFQPADVLKGTLRSGLRGTRFRQSLVIFQFAISIVLTIASTIVYGQLDYLRGKDLGFDKEQVLVMSVPNGDVSQKYEGLKGSLLQHPDIVNVSAASDVPPDRSLLHANISPEGVQDHKVWVRVIAVHYDFIETLGFEIEGGRAFWRDLKSNVNEGVILTDDAVKRMGWESPASAIGQRCELLGKGKTVIGVIGDFHIESLHKKMGPIVFMLNPNSFSQLVVRLRSDRISNSLSFLKKAWTDRFPEWPFEYRFIDENFDRLYRAEEKMGKMAGTFTLFAVFVASLGLFGLASFTAEQRTKEIGIRKTLGATVSNIVLLLSKDFVKLVLLANVIAWPAAYYAMSNWLQNFAYRIEPGIGTFVLGGVLALLIALVTVSYQAVKAAVANPVDALRYE